MFQISPVSMLSQFGSVMGLVADPTTTLKVTVVAV